MKNPTLSARALALVLCVLAACGASSVEVKGAKSAHYKGDKLVIFNAIKEAVAAKYKLEKSDETTLGLQTIGRWFTPEGLAASERGDMRDVPDRSLNVTLVVTMHADGDAWVVQVTPAYLRYFAGRPNPDKLAPDDPSIPGWATGKVDALAVDVHEALKSYEVQTLPGTIPAGNGAAPGAGPAAPAPAEPPPAAPAGGGY